MAQSTLLTLAFLIVFPLVAAGILFVVRNARVRSVVVTISAALIMVASVLLASGHLMGSAQSALVEFEPIAYLVVAVEIICCLYVLVKGIRHKKPLAVMLAAVQAGIVVALESFFAHGVAVSKNLSIDAFSVIMVLVIGVIGSGICLYANGYMRDFQEHEDARGAPDRRSTFFALMFVFLSAMFVIVLSNDLTWLLCGWEVTTVCSFALIGYTRTEEAINNSFRQINMNLAGGIAFSLALIYLTLGYNGTEPILELDKLIASGSTGLFALPVMLLAIAAFTKAAQVPFQSWLLGAMVAPTPTSALLHSSTMVKAGVFLLIKLAPCLGWNPNGIMVALIGGFTFLACSCMAISQSNAKRVLAYSTVANLGLIVACAGVGTAEATWAAIFLLIFHAAAKSLLFLCVGTTEHHIGSRDIEDMDDLFTRMPRIARFTVLGILCMFIAPFGMLISKWATLVSLADTGHLLLIALLAYGSAATFMFWAKWLGKMLAVAKVDKDLEKTVHGFEWFSLALMAILSVGMSVGFPLISAYVVTPYLTHVFATEAGVSSALTTDNLLIMAAIVLTMLAVFGVQFIRQKKVDGVDIYLAGVGRNSDQRSYQNSLSTESQATQRNWYLDGWFGEKALSPVANTVNIVFMLLGFCVAILTSLGIVGIGGVS
jgi:ech hydrogenase subunit A